MGTSTGRVDEEATEVITPSDNTLAFKEVDDMILLNLISRHPSIPVKRVENPNPLKLDKFLSRVFG